MSLPPELPCESNDMNFISVYSYYRYTVNLVDSLRCRVTRTPMQACGRCIDCWRARDQPLFYGASLHHRVSSGIA